MFFKHCIVLWEPSGTDMSLLAGQHSWSFSFELPVNLPPTLYFEDWTAIFYQCRGYIDPGMLPNQKLTNKSVLVNHLRKTFDEN